MTRGLRVVSGAIGAALVMVVTSCQSGPPQPNPSSSQQISVADRFADQADALNRAKLVYRQYLTVADRISADGGAGVDRLNRFVTKAQLQSRIEGAMYLSKNHLRVAGATQIVKFDLQRADLRTGAVAAYVCVDVGETRVTDAQGVDVTPASRQDKQTLLATFVWERGGLLVDESSTWSGDSIC